MYLSEPVDRRVMQKIERRKEEVEQDSKMKYTHTPIYCSLKYSNSNNGKKPKLYLNSSNNKKLLKGSYS